MHSAPHPAAGRGQPCRTRTRSSIYRQLVVCLPANHGHARVETAMYGPARALWALRCSAPLH
eukprot:COSAG01_NODE_4242_length_5211_cov_24.571401_11_plen_62_part_00